MERLRISKATVFIYTLREPVLFYKDTYKPISVHKTADMAQINVINGLKIAFELVIRILSRFKVYFYTFMILS